MAGMIFGAVVNAFPFTGSSYLFKKLDNDGYEKESKRHNLAQEKLQKATSEWVEHRKQTIDYANLQIKREHDAAIDFRNTDSALALYKPCGDNGSLVLGPGC
jgi:hypothetical protein